jgi:hypothetical protein
VPMMATRLIDLVIEIRPLMDVGVGLSSLKAARRTR